METWEGKSFSVTDPKGVKTVIYQVIKTPKNYRLVNSNFEITKDFKTIVVDNHAYAIPDYYNIDMIKNEDEKTWQMIFYQIFADKINAELINRSKVCI